MTHKFSGALALLALFTTAQSSTAQAAQRRGGQSQTDQVKAGQRGQNKGQSKGQEQGQGEEQGQRQGADSSRTQSKNDQNSTEPTALTSGSTAATGCLQRGSTAGSYKITGSDGKSYDLKTSNDSVKMTDHVGHRVMVMSAVDSGGAQSQSGNQDQNGVKNESSKQSSPNKQGGNNHSSGMLDVTSLTMVSSSCN